MREDGSAYYAQDTWDGSAQLHALHRQTRRQTTQLRVCVLSARACVCAWSCSCGRQAPTATPLETLQLRQEQSRMRRLRGSRESKVVRTHHI